MAFTTTASIKQNPSEGAQKESRVIERSSDDKEKCTVFVGDLVRRVTKEEVISLFSTFGEVVNVEVKRDRNSGNNLGYGFVEFLNREYAKAAIQSQDDLQLRGRQLRLGWAHKSTSLFIYNLNSSVTTKTLQETCRKFGEIMTEATFVRLNQGFVQYVNRSDAESAKNELDGKPFPGSGSGPTIRILWGEACLRSVFVQLLSANPSACELVEADIESAFGKFGTVESTRLCRDHKMALRGFGFVHFSDDAEGEKSAANAIEALDNTSVGDGIIMRCYYGRKQGRHRRSGKRSSRYSPSSSVSSVSSSEGVSRHAGGQASHPTADYMFYMGMPLPVFPVMESYVYPVYYWTGDTTYYPCPSADPVYMCQTSQQADSTMSGSSG